MHNNAANSDVQKQRNAALLHARLWRALGGRDTCPAEVLERLLCEDVAAGTPFVAHDLGGILAFYVQTHLPPDRLLRLNPK